MPGGFALPKKERLTNKSRFNAVFKNGRRISSPCGLCVILFENGLGSNRLGLAVPKAKIRLSSTRNRTKRLLKEAYRTNKNRLNPGFDIILYANKTIKDFKEAENLLMSVLKAAKLLKSP